jgi:hypothetical protein
MCPDLIDRVIRRTASEFDQDVDLLSEDTGHSVSPSPRGRSRPVR